MRELAPLEGSTCSVAHHTGRGSAWWLPSLPYADCTLRMFGNGYGQEDACQLRLEVWAHDLTCDSDACSSAKGIWCTCIERMRTWAIPKAPSGRSPDSAARSPMRALPGASLMPLLMRSNTLPACMAGGCSQLVYRASIRKWLCSAGASRAHAQRGYRHLTC